MDLLTFEKENSERMKAVENSFGASGRPLFIPGRVLVGKGRLMKQGRRKPQPRSFFLFNDVLVYGSIILNGHWHNKQKVIRLETIQLQDLEDGVEMRNQWLIRTPRKSFFVSACTQEEKRAWIDHIESCKSSLQQDGSCQLRSNLAPSWIPDQAAFKCMRCLNKFTATNRRHHCRRCGFVVCNSCSKQRVVIDHIHPTKKLRVCRRCHNEDETSRLSGDSTGKNSSEEEDVAALSDEGERGEVIQGFTQSSWLDTRMGTWTQRNP